MKSSLFLKQAAGAAVFFTVIFISAGHLLYWPGIAYTSLGLLILILNYTVWNIDAGLQQERSKPGADAKKWDKSILGLSFLATLGMFITAGLDSGRFHWSPAFPVAAHIGGFLLTAAGQAIFLLAQHQNKFFSSMVRIQTDRGHTVCDTGLYRFVRHPAYMGSFIQTLGFPLLFGSLWSIIPVFVSICLLVVRTSLEDQTLQNELNGYLDYSRKTRFRLIPFVW